jgi:hypothetical protein
MRLALWLTVKKHSGRGNIDRRANPGVPEANLPVACPAAGGTSTPSPSTATATPS